MVDYRRINDEFEARVERVVVVRLYRNGQQIVDGHGRPAEYASLDDAEYVARNWSVYGCPPYGLSDAELREGLRHLRALDAER